MRESIRFANEVIEEQRSVWEAAIKELEGGDEAWFHNGSDSPVERVMTQPDVFLARLPRKYFTTKEPQAAI